MRVNSAKLNPNSFVGDELRVAPKKIYDGTGAESRQTRLEAYETEKLHKAMEQEYQRQER